MPGASPHHLGSPGVVMGGKEDPSKREARATLKKATEWLVLLPCDSDILIYLFIYDITLSERGTPSCSSTG